MRLPGIVPTPWHLALTCSLLTEDTLSQHTAEQRLVWEGALQRRCGNQSLTTPVEHLPGARGHPVEVLSRQLSYQPYPA